MKRIALFVFHKDWNVCANRIEILRQHNPTVDIHGLFGGHAADWKEAQTRFSNVLSTLYQLTDKDGRWKWQNTDLCVRVWYKDHGFLIDFDVLHIVQWDLLMLDSLSNIYATIPADAVGLTGITPVAAIASRWHWTTADPHNKEFGQLQDYARVRFGYNDEYYACLGPGYCLPRKFIERYAKEEVPELGHDELRLPLFARALGFTVLDTGFYRKWFDPAEERFFNADSEDIADRVIRNELRKPNGRRVFHPYRKVFDGQCSPELNGVLNAGRAAVGTWFAALTRMTGRAGPNGA